MSKSLDELYSLWESFREIPVATGDGDIQEDGLEEPFLHFPKGTHREDVWKWFEAQNADFSVGEAMTAGSDKPAHAHPRLKGALQDL